MNNNRYIEYVCYQLYSDRLLTTSDEEAGSSKSKRAPAAAACLGDTDTLRFTFTLARCWLRQ